MKNLILTLMVEFHIIKVNGLHLYSVALYFSYTIIHASVVMELPSNALNFNGVFMSCGRDCRDGKYVYYMQAFASLHNLKTAEG